MVYMPFPIAPFVLSCLTQESANVEALEVVPANERTQGQWNGDPYDLVGGSGYREYDGGAWLLPYWMARYHGLIV